MTPRISSSAALVASLLACKNSGPADPEPALPEADMLAAFDPAALVDRPGAPPRVSTGAALAVLDYAPQGRTAGGAAIKVRFNQPVVALGVEQIPDVSRFLAFDPPLKGDASFQTPDLLVFHPAEPLQDATTYTVRFAPGLVGLDGQRLDKGVEWTFETPRPQVLGADPLRRNDSLPASRRDTPFVVSFDQPTTLAEVRAHLVATARPLAREDAKPAPVQLQIRETTAAEHDRAGYYGYDPRDDRGRYFTVRPQGLWPGDSELCWRSLRGSSAGAARCRSRPRGRRPSRRTARRRWSRCRAARRPAAGSSRCTSACAIRCARGRPGMSR
ncbi:Ig-like domain-containing protein [Nannocystis pusilla]|uniref:Ig-like domain-containing protein n=1 Tax=Nannocystis pusilla TaxID=889268 RepID=UPI003B78D1F5